MLSMSVSYGTMGVKSVEMTVKECPDPLSAYATMANLGQRHTVNMELESGLN